nr:DNA mismatch repair protein MutS [Cellulosilyticum sp. I15G10I2]
MNVTPMMKQYLDIKEKHQDCLLFFRLGDFYEMFFEDAKTASRELEITLTGRDCGLEERAPMCGVPFHAADNYIGRLVEKGYKVAICEQVEDASLAKGIVKREVVRIVTPGTILEGSTVSEGKNNYICAIVNKDNAYGLSISDVTTGEWSVTYIEGEKNTRKLLDELAKYSPVECLLDQITYNDAEIYDFIKSKFVCMTQQIPNHCLDISLSYSLLTRHFNVSSLEGIGLIDDRADTLAASSLLYYLKETQKNTLSHMHTLSLYNVDAYMLLDMSTRRNLELTETLREKRRKGSLLWVLDHTKTAMGSRYIRKCIEQPLIHADKINERLDATEELKNNALLRADLFEALDHIYDIERLMSKAAYGTCNAKDLLSLKASLGVLPAIYNLLHTCNSTKLIKLYQNFDALEDVFSMIDASILEDAPLSLREGSLIKDGFNEEVDRLRQIKKEGTSWLMAIEAKEKEKTGIKNLKIKYNKVFGYFLEVTQSYHHLVPDYFIRKQTLSNCERYITEELKQVESDVLGADDKLNVLEYQLFTQVRENIVSQMDRLLTVSHFIAELDMFCSLADVADQYHYIKPVINHGQTINITGSRHPVVEKIIGEHSFIANDVYLDNKTHQVMLLTGPNMAGKSTFMRQVALIVLMAQVGSFVPAENAEIGVADRIFTRVGASDDLASGQSTFMVEMMEVSNILHHATKDSLLILDEIGRGTSTLDGLSIAWSIIEHIATEDKLGAKTLFATHYHELTDLEKNIPSLKNYCVAVKEMGEDIIFLHKIVPGSVDHSYGIQVAKLAGVPSMVLERAKSILSDLEKDQTHHLNVTADKPLPVEKMDKKGVAQQASQQLSLFENKHVHVINELKALDVMDLTPMKALQVLYDLQKKIR